jgi:hypothetical protein
VEVSSGHDNCVKVCLRSIFESNSVSRNTRQKWFGIKVLGPLIWHRLAPEAASNAFGSVLPTHGGNIFGGVGCSNNQNSLVFELFSISDIVSMDDSSLEIVKAFNLRHIRGAEMSTSNYHVVEDLGEISVVFELSSSNRKFRSSIIESHAHNTSVCLDPLFTLVLLESGHDVVV